MVMIYNVIVLPYLSYCSLVWACNSNNKLYPVIILQIRALRNITNSVFHTHTRRLSMSSLTRRPAEDLRVSPGDI